MSVENKLGGSTLNRAAVAVLVSLVLVGACVGVVSGQETGDRNVSMQASGSANIINENPARGSAIEGDKQVTFDFTVDYDTGGKSPGYISVSVGEDKFVTPQKKIDVTQQSGQKNIQITETVDSSWDEAVVNIDLFPESDNTAIDSDTIRYSPDGNANVEIINENPTRGATLQGGNELTFDFTVDYDTGGKSPGQISASVGEDRFASSQFFDITTESGTKNIQITKTVDSSWSEAVVDVNLYSDS